MRHLREVLPRRFPGVEFFFQPADIVTQILNFGLPAPIDVQVVGTDMQSNYAIAQQIANKMRHIPGTADVHVQQLLSAAHAAHGYRPHARHPGGADGARRGAERAGLAERQLPDGAEFLAEPEERRHLSDRGAVAAIPHDQSAGPDGHPGQSRSRARN